MDININLSYGKESINNLAFIKAVFIKHSIENLNITYTQKEALRNKILKELQKSEESDKGVLNEKEN